MHRYYVGGLVSLTLALAAACNVAPEADGLTIGPDAPTTVDDLTARFASEPTDANASDNVKTVFVWEVLNPGFAEFEETSLTGNRVPSSETVKGQVWKVTATVTDGDESVVLESPELTVLNSAPTATQARVTPATGITTFSTLTASGMGDDIDGDQVDLQIHWYVDGVELDVDSNTLPGEYFSKGQEVWVEVVPSDGETEGAAVQSNAVVVGNTAPSLASAVISPANPDESTTLSCDTDGWFDDDGDEAQVQVAWLVNGVEVSTADTLDGSMFDRGDTVRCSATPFDGDDVGHMIFSGAVSIGNSAPTIDGVVLTSSSPRGADSLSFTVVGASDPDGDSVQTSAAWYVDGELAFEGNELPAGFLARGQTVWVVVTPDDGKTTGEPVQSDEGLAANSPPTIVSVTLTPSQLLTDSRAFPDVVSNDFDGDRLTYAVTWYVNGTAVSATSSTLDGETWFDRDDKVRVEITANDGTDSSAVATSAEVTVGNYRPTDPEVSITPELVKDDVDIVCVVDVDATDKDPGEVLTRTFSWTRNGSEFTDTATTTIAGDTVRSTNTADFDDFICTYSVSDGLETVTASATVQIRNWAGPREFNSCGETGPTGPSLSDCSTEYTGTTLDEDTWTVLSGGLQEWTVPEDGTYSIEASGAQGGSTIYGGSGSPGARIKGEFDLKAGDKITVLVGQSGTGYYYGAGGGGGTFVVNEDGDPLVVAGGGGGAGYYTGTDCGGSATTKANGPSYEYDSYCYSTSTAAGEGGSYYYAYYYYPSWDEESFNWMGSGGGGFYSDGTGYDDGEGGLAFVNGGEGGYGPTNEGGFGGGGTGYSRYGYAYYGYEYFYDDDWGAGGAGGYTGGTGGYYAGGGGGSYNAGSSQSNQKSKHSGDGKVVFDKLR